MFIPIMENFYYNANQLLSHDCLFNFVISNRGGGKTFDFKKRAIKRFLKHGEQFIYLRRYKEELKTINQFFDDIIESGLFKGHKLKVKNRIFYVDNKVAGYAMLLSTAVTKKSTPYPKVTLIGFDEFIIDKGMIRYLPMEVTKFLELYNTVARLRDNVKVIFMGNAISLTNPYFLFWNIQLNTQKRFNKYGEICVEMFTDENFTNAMRNTRFGKLVSGTRYGDYAIENKFFLNNDDFILKKSSNAIFQFSIYYQQTIIGFWYDFDDGKIYACSKIKNDSKIKFTLTTKEHKPNYQLITNYKNNFYIKQIIKAFHNSYLYFESQIIKDICYNMFSLFM